MTWLRLDDAFLAHPKLVGASMQAKLLHIACMLYSARYLTDGFVTTDAVNAEARSQGIRPGRASELVSRELWEDAEGGWTIHDWHKYQPSRIEVMARREAQTDRVRKWRDDRNGVSNTVGNAVTRPVVAPLVTPPPARPGPSYNPKPQDLEPRAASPRARNPIFDALCESCGMDPTSVPKAEARTIAVKSSELSKLGVAQDEVLRRGSDENWDRVMPPGTTKTPAAIVNNWARLGGTSRGSDSGDKTARRMGMVAALERREREAERSGAPGNKARGFLPHG